MLRYGHSTYSFRSTLVDTLMIYHIGIDWGAHREENVRSLDLCSTLWTLVHGHKNQKTQSKIFNWSMWKGWTSCFRWGSGCLVITWSHSSLAGQWKRLASWGLLVISHSTVNSPGSDGRRNVPIPPPLSKLRSLEPRSKSTSWLRMLCQTEPINSNLNSLESMTLWVSSTWAIRHASDERKCGSYNSGIMQRHLPGSILIVRDRLWQKTSVKCGLHSEICDKIMKSENSAQIPRWKLFFSKRTR